MSHQEPQNQVKTEEASVEKRRRFIKGAGIATPVVLSLVNRSAFGAAQQCLSQQISGNMSQAAGAGSCESGQSPLTWKGPNIIGTNITQFSLVSDVSTGPTEAVNKNVRATFTGSSGGPNGEAIKIVQTTNVTEKTFQWAGTGFNYGVLTTTQTVTKINKINGAGTIGAIVSTEVTVNSVNSGSGIVNVNDKFTAGTKWEYTGGVPLTFVTSATLDDSNTLPAAKCSDFTGGTTFNAAFGNGSALPMREILCTSAASEDAYCVTALLNAAFVPAFNYVLNVSDVKALCSGTSQVPQGSASLSAFLASTWLNQP